MCRGRFRAIVVLSLAGLAALPAEAAPRTSAKVAAKRPASKTTGRSQPKPAATKAKAAADEEAITPDANDPDSERIVRMQEALNSIVRGPVLGRLRVGIRVMEAGSGRTFFGRRSAVLMDPASNQKVLATTTALMRLGSTWRFRTELTGRAPDAEGVVTGDLVLRGSGDPSLLTTHLEEMVADLLRRGITRVDGAVLADPRRIGTDEVGAGEHAPLRVSRAAIVVRVRPGNNTSAAASIVVRPAAEAFVVNNHTQTRAKGPSRVTVSVTSAAGRMVVTVAGRISLRSPGVVIRRVPPNQSLYAAAVLRGALMESGISVRDQVGATAGKAVVRVGGEGLAPAGPLLLALHESDPLGVMIRRINKDSDNEYADRLLETVGAEIYGGAATSAKGVRALREALTEIGLSPGAYVPVNGSGLGHANRITADAMADLLRRIFLDPRFGPEIVQSLSVGGIDGTTRNRFRGSPAAERVRAKTGTLRGKSCLSGYVGDGSDVLVFSILCDGLRGRRLAAVRGAQVNAVNAMMRYVRGAEGTGDELAPGVDLESGEESLESEDNESADDAPVNPAKAGGDPLDALLDKALPKAADAPAPK